MPSGKITSGNNSSDNEMNNILGIDDKKWTTAQKKRMAELHKTEVEYEKDLQRLKETGLSKLERTKKQERDAERKDELDWLREKYDTAQNYEEKLQLVKEINAKKLEQAASDSLKKVTDKFSSDFNDYLGAYQKYISVIDTRLQGADKSYRSITEVINRAVGVNPFVSQTKVMEKLSSLVEQGINYNVEQRAFLGSISDRIAATFDAANGTLLQLIRIQQADSTAARLGLESSLNKFFNSTFKDTSYLNGLSDTVSANILGANSQLSRDGSVAFEYVVQKWLGSMSSVGVSDNTIQMLAQGLNYLGTGDIESLNSNSALQNLLVMAANNSGIDYAKLLTGGLNANTANKLLQGVVQYGQQIANTNNQVTKSKYAQIFGMTVADLTSLLNLSSQDLVSISNNMLNYSQTIAETEQGLSTLINRTSIADMVNNVFDNVISTMGEGIASNPALYVTWRLNDLIEKATGGINIPAIFGMGTGVDLNANVNQLIKLGVVGISTLSNMGTILSGLSRISGFDLNAFGAEATTGRGNGLSTTLADSNVATTVSSTSFIGNTNSSDIYESSITSAKEEAAATISGQEENESLILLRDHISVDVRQIVQLLGVDGIVVREISPIASLGLISGGI